MDMEHGIWHMDKEHGIYLMKHDYGTWDMEHCTWLMEYGTWNLPHGTWLMGHGSWHMTHGTWLMEHGTLTLFCYIVIYTVIVSYVSLNIYIHNCQFYIKYISSYSFLLSFYLTRLISLHPHLR